MALKLTIKPEDVKAAKIITPGPYRFKVRAFYPKPAKDKSMNYVAELIGMEGDATDVRILKFFNEKFIAPIVPFLRALGQEVSEDNLTEVDLEGAIGMEVIGFVETSMRDNKPQNDINAWKNVNEA